MTDSFKENFIFVWNPLKTSGIFDFLLESVKKLRNIVFSTWNSSKNSRICIKTLEYLLFLNIYTNSSGIYNILGEYHLFLYIYAKFSIPPKVPLGKKTRNAL